MGGEEKFWNSQLKDPENFHFSVLMLSQVSLPYGSFQYNWV